MYLFVSVKLYHYAVTNGKRKKLYQATIVNTTSMLLVSERLLRSSVNF